MNIIENFAQPLFLIIIWTLFIIWSALFWILKLERGSLKFLYWDFVFAILLTLTFLTTLSFFAVGIEYKKIWLLIPPIVYGLFDLAENAVLVSKYPEKTPLARFLTTGKWIFYFLSNLLLIVLIVIYFVK